MITQAITLLPPSSIQFLSVVLPMLYFHFQQSLLVDLISVCNLVTFDHRQGGGVKSGVSSELKGEPVKRHDDPSSKKEVRPNPETDGFRSNPDMSVQSCIDADTKAAKNNCQYSDEEDKFFTACEDIYEDHDVSDVNKESIFHLVECADPGFLTSTPKKAISRHIDTVW